MWVAFHKDHLDHRVLKGIKDPKDLRDPKDHLDHKEHRGHKGRLGHRGRKDHRERKDHRCRKDHRELEWLSPIPKTPRLAIRRYFLIWGHPIPQPVSTRSLQTPQALTTRPTEMVRLPATQ